MGERIRIDMTMPEALMAITEGNPGALRVCVDLLRDGESIDPDSAFGGFGAVLSLDTLGIYGPRIWMLYKDVCGENLVATVGVLRAHQLGVISDAALRAAINGASEIDVEGLLSQVRSRLPRFSPVTTAAG